MPGGGGAGSGTYARLVARPSTADPQRPKRRQPPPEQQSLRRWGPNQCQATCAFRELLLRQMCEAAKCTRLSNRCTQTPSSGLRHAALEGGRCRKAMLGVCAPRLRALAFTTSFLLRAKVFPIDLHNYDFPHTEGKVHTPRFPARGMS